MFERLDNILTIPDKERRLQELKKCAEDVGVFHALEKQYGDQYSEQQLVIAIYDGYMAIKDDSRKSRRFIFYVAAGLAAAVFLLFFVPKALVNYLKLLQDRQEKLLKAYKGYDEEGELVKDEQGRPVLFHDMEGYYEEYYNDGTLHYDYLYSEGKVVEKKEYNKKGEVIAHFLYDKDGNPILAKGE